MLATTTTIDEKIETMIKPFNKADQTESHEQTNKASSIAQKTGQSHFYISFDASVVWVPYKQSDHGNIFLSIFEDKFDNLLVVFQIFCIGIFLLTHSGTKNDFI